MHETHRARKRFGQHFLTDHNVIARIVQAIRPLPTDNLVEIGAGHGAITDRVFEQSQRLHVIEIDRDLTALLREKYADKALIVHEGDALKFDFSTLHVPSAPLLRVFGNLPYNISTPILFHLLRYADCIQDMVFMLQKEVIDRLAATPSHHDYGRLTVMIQYACQVTRLFDIPPSAFSPPPKVMSSIVILKPHGSHRSLPIANDYDHFANLVNVAFQHRRKTIKNALGKMVSPDAFLQAGIDPIQRPETITVEQYVILSNLAAQ